MQLDVLKVVLELFLFLMEMKKQMLRFLILLAVAGAGVAEVATTKKEITLKRGKNTVCAAKKLLSEIVRAIWQ